MDALPNSEMVIRPSWPLPDWGGRRIRYGLPLMMVSGAAVIFATTRWVSVGMPLGVSELNEVVAALTGLGLAITAAIYFEGTTIAANRERVVVTRWFRVASIVPVADLASLTRSTVQVRGYRRRIVDSHQVSFITHGAQCLLTVNWDRFTDDDLDQLSKVTGVRQDGGWFYKRLR
jgi:hypothetical protein